MNCSNGEGGGLFIFVVHFVEVLVEERRVVDAVQPVRRIVLRENNRILVDAREISAVFHKLLTNCLIYNINSVAITNKMQLGNGNLLFHSTLKAQHVSRVMSLIIRNFNCIYSFWFTYACGDRPWCRLSGNWLSQMQLSNGIYYSTVH
jgi:hypothetical protein